MYVLYGYGECGKECANIIGKENILFFVDSDINKRNVTADIPVFSFEEKIDELKTNKATVMVSVSGKYENEIIKALESANITNYEKYSTLRANVIRKQIAMRPDYLGTYKKAINWIVDHSAKNIGIAHNSHNPLPYPEVTGYYIPSLMRWGYRELALTYAKWLCSIQKNDGAWFDTFNKAPYVFDTAQILKGLLTVRELLPEIDSNIRRGCEWILENMLPNGRLTTPSQDAWGDGSQCSELIHLYCLSPLRDAGRVFYEPRYEEAANKILQYYLDFHLEEIENFSLLSHFYAYVMEGLIDMGRADITARAMSKVASLQKEDGSVPAYKNVNWVCSTGLFQFAVIWYRLGDLERGDKAFTYACKLQSPTGGWYGSYVHHNYTQENNDYFSVAEISWANKYFLDALYYKNCLQFNNTSVNFFSSIDPTDGRYLVIKSEIEQFTKGNGDMGARILDIGCGKGRYLKNLLNEMPNNKYYATDISDKVMKYIISDKVEKKIGSLTCIPFNDNTFDVAYTCEALEHAVDIDSAIREMARVVVSGGRIIIIDKPKEALGALEIGEWEQWFDYDELKAIMLKYCSTVKIIKDIDYENNYVPGLFAAWIGTVR